MKSSTSKSVFAVLVAASVLLGVQWTWAGNLPTWGGATTTNQTQVQQPSEPLISEPVVNTAPTVQPTQPRPLRSPGTALTPITRTPALQRPTQQAVPGDATQWAQWGDLAWNATKTAVNTRWRLQATIQNVTINGPTANGPPGCLQGPDLGPAIRSHLLSSDVPVEVADIFADGIGGAWKAWQDSVTIPGLPWYPAFAAWAGPAAPPMPNVSVPLIALSASRQGELTSAERLAARFFEQFHGKEISPEIRGEIQRISQLFSTGFLRWFASAQVMDVMGQGPVPSFTPPYVPTGPVVGGTVIPQPGVITGNLR